MDEASKDTQKSENEPSETKEDETGEEPRKEVSIGGEVKEEETDEEDRRRETTNKGAETSVKCEDTRVEMSDTEDESEARDRLGQIRTNNPKITISEPVNSPCDSDPGGPKRAPEPRGRCPIYYGIKSYIHDFYYPPDKEILKSGDFIQEDDFQFLVEPGKRRWRGCWLRASIWVGVNLMLVGIIAMLIGHLTPPRKTVIHQPNNQWLWVDNWAINFNNRLIMCQHAGLAGFMSGAVIVMLAILVSSYLQEQTLTYCVKAATVVPETFVGHPLVSPKAGWGSHRIPLTGCVKGVQPSFTHVHK